MTQCPFVTPEAFRDAYQRVMLRRSGELFSPWNDRRRFTSLMLRSSQPPAICQEVASELNLSYCPEYWSLDAIFFHSKDEEHFPPQRIYAEGIDVALEHEIDRLSAIGELYKLMMINTPLKVLIAYPAENRAQQLLHLYADVVKRTDIFDDCSVLRRLLVVLGWIYHTETR
jgi:hypothetical protein